MRRGAMAKSKANIEPRRQPAQARGRERVSKILDAADDVFFEVGYQGATTDGIAARAGASIGSVYQFFPNKAALFRALALRYLDEIRALYAKVAEGGALDGPAHDIIARVLGEFAAFHRRRPAFRQLMLTSFAVPELLAATEEMHREFEHGVQALLLLRAKRMTPERASAVAAITIMAFGAVIWTATRGDSGFERRALDEGAALLSGYLDGMLKPSVVKRK